MTLLSEDDILYFAERGKTRAERLVLRLPKDGTLIFNGTRYFPKDGVVRIPKGALFLGENTVAVRYDNRTVTAEGLFYDGDSISPQGLPVEPLLFAAQKKITALEERTLLLEQRLCALEASITRKRLFS